jgi:MFS family permease
MYDRNTSVRLTNIIFAAESFNSASRIAIFTLLSIIAVKISGSETVAGFPSTTMTLVQAFSALPFGILMGRVGRRIGLTVGYGISWVGVLLGLVAIIYSWFWMLLLASALLGMGRAGTDMGRFAAGDMFPQKDRARMIGRVVFAGTMGAIFGPLLVNPGTAFAQYLRLNTDTGPFLIATGFFGISILITFFFLRPEPMDIAREVGGDEQKKKVETEDGTARPIRELLKLPRVQLAVMSMLISQVVMVTLMVITPLYMYHHNHDNGAVSLVIAAHTLGMFGLSTVTGQLIDRFGRVPMMIGGALLLVAAALVSPLSTSVPVLMLGLFLLGLGWNFGYIAGSSLLGDALQGEERAKMQGTNDMLVAGAAAVGSFSSGPIFSMGGYVSVAGMGLILAILFGWIIWMLAPSEPQIKIVSS